ncbi:MAG TPA: hypothetical protein VJN69_14645 [Candidatus Acidoferrales bacterium]|nr:hypothetical protein [Candidatus Acidoferrales bacterium]
MRSHISRTASLSVAGIFVQAACLALFAFVSQSRIATLGKPLVYALAMAGIIYIIWHAVTQRSSWMSLCLVPIFLGLGYVAAWELVGAVLFKGLLWDVYAHSPSLNDIWLHLDIACLLAGIYGIATAIIFAVHKGLEKRRN